MMTILFCSLSPTISAAPFPVERFRFSESLDAHREMLFSEKTDAAELLALPAAEWQTALPAHRFTPAKASLWLKTTLHNRLQVPAEVTLRLHTSLWSSVHFYILNQNRLTEQSHAIAQGAKQEFSFALLQPSHSLRLEPDAERTVLIAVQGQPPRDVHLELLDTSSHQEETFAQLLRWTLLLAILALLSFFAWGLSLGQRRGLPLAFALYNLSILLFLIHLANWPLATFFPIPPQLPSVPLQLLFYGSQASLLLLLKQLGTGLMPQPVLQKGYWMAQGYLVLHLSLAMLFLPMQPLLFIIPAELIVAVLLLIVHGRMQKEGHDRQRMVSLLLAQTIFHLGLWCLVLAETFPLWRLPEALLWSSVVGNGAIFSLILPGNPAHDLSKEEQKTVASEPSPTLKPEAKTKLLHEQWLHAEKRSALGTFTNGLANELNNPLAIIAGHRFRLSSMIESRSFNIHEFEKSLSKIDQAVNRMIAVIDALKVYTQEPQSQEQLKPFSVRETIKYAIDLCRDKVVSLGITFATSELLDTTIEGHQGQIIQVLLILVDNAIDALESAPEKSIRIDVQVTAETVRIAVIDSGPGVPLGLRGKIWDPFFTSKDPFRHKGLGLSIASGIVSQHRGRLLLDDTTPETRFVVELPRSRPPRRTGHAAQEA